MRLNWADFVAATTGYAPWPLLKQAAGLAGQPGHALDLGCGGGRDTRYLLAQGWSVTAVDGEPTAIAGLAAPASPRLQLIQSAFEEFDYSPQAYDLINAQYALPFIAPPQLPPIFARIRRALRPGGVFTGQFFGLRDGWNTPGQAMTFLDRTQVEALLVGMELLALTEEDEVGPTALGSSKRWHVFHVIGRQ